MAACRHDNSIPSAGLQGHESTCLGTAYPKLGFSSTRSW